MIDLLTGNQMKQLDLMTIQKKEMPSMVLMERASLSMVEEMLPVLGTAERILVVCGTGNNGGDGMAIARLLHQKGYLVDVFLLGKKEKFTRETKAQYQILCNYQVTLVNNPQWDEYTTIVDAIFGIGLSRNVEGDYKTCIHQMNEARGTLWAVDLPSGLNGEMGQPMGTCVQADFTVTFAYHKLGLILYPGASYAGKVFVKDIGIYAEDEDHGEFVKSLEPGDLSWMPPRLAQGNKGTFGKVLVVAGSTAISGAAYFSGKAALLSGAGMVKIHTSWRNRDILATLLPEALYDLDEEMDEDCERRWQGNLDWCDVVVMGPGLGQDEMALKKMEFYTRSCEKPMVIDADGLNLLAGHKQLWKNKKSAWILTPHMGELSRLTGWSIPELKRNMLSFSQSFAQAQGVTLVAKDARSIVVTEDGQTFVNPSGNHGMATAGSGDVLSGILGGLLAQWDDVARMTPLGVYLHGLAGDAAQKKMGSYSMCATDILHAIPAVWKKGSVEDESV